MNELCNQQKGKLSSPGGEFRSFTVPLGKSLLSDLKPSAFEIFKTELGFRCRAESTYWPWEESKLATIVDICYLGSTACRFHQLGKTARTSKQVFDLLPSLFIAANSPRLVSYCYAASWNGGNMFTPVQTQAVAEQLGELQVSLVATLETQYQNTIQERKQLEIALHFTL